MYIYGSGITEFEFRTDSNYNVETQWDLEWFQVSNGDYHAIDRGASGDYYGASITTFGTETYINNIITQLESNRQSDGILYMSGFAGNEHIFGEDVDHTLVSGYVVGYGVRTQNSFKGYSFSLDIRALSPSFTGSASLPDWTSACVFHSPKIKAYSSWSVNNYDTYYSDVQLYDKRTDTGTFKGTFRLSLTELRDLRRWYATNRDTSFSITSLNGVTYMFGNREGTGPWTVKLIDINEAGWFGLDYKLVELTIVRNYGN